MVGNPLVLSVYTHLHPPTLIWLSNVLPPLKDSPTPVWILTTIVTTQLGLRSQFRTSVFRELGVLCVDERGERRDFRAERVGLLRARRALRGAARRRFVRLVSTRGALLPRAPELLARAFALALSGRPGPVVVTLPEDLLLTEAPAVVAKPAPRPEPSPDAGTVGRLAALIEEAERPVLWVGGPGWTSADRENIERFATGANVPVVTAWRRKAHFNNSHSHYAGELGLGANPKLVERVKSSDLIIALGTRLGEVTSLGYTLPAVPEPEQPLVHVHPDAGTLTDVRRPTLAIQASSRLAAHSLAELGYLLDGDARADWVASARADYEAWTEPTEVEAGVNPAAVIRHLSETLPPDTIFTNGAGNFAAWLHRFHHHREVGTQLAPTSGAMGYGVPAAIAAALVTGDRSVCVAGDGDFLMSGSELATAVRYGAKTLFVVIDNGQLGTIRMHQQRDFPGRQSGTALTNPDFAAYAESFGVKGWTVERTEDFADALDEALGADGPALIRCRTDPNEIAPGRRVA